MTSPVLTVPCRRPALPGDRLHAPAPAAPHAGGRRGRRRRRHARAARGAGGRGRAAGRGHRPADPRGQLRGPRRGQGGAGRSSPSGCWPTACRRRRSRRCSPKSTTTSIAGCCDLLAGRVRPAAGAVRLHRHGLGRARREPARSPTRTTASCSPTIRTSGMTRSTVVHRARRAHDGGPGRAAFPLCRGGVMATNPVWRKTLPQWRQQVASWMRGRVPEIAAALRDPVRLPLRLRRRRAGRRAAPGVVTEAAPRDHAFLMLMFGLQAEHRAGIGLFGRLLTSAAAGASRQARPEAARHAAAGRGGAAAGAQPGRRRDRHTRADRGAAGRAARSTPTMPTICGPRLPCSPGLQLRQQMADYRAGTADRQLRRPAASSRSASAELLKRQPARDQRVPRAAGSLLNSRPGHAQVLAGDRSGGSGRRCWPETKPAALRRPVGGARRHRRRVSGRARSAGQPPRCRCGVRPISASSRSVSADSSFMVCR